MTEHKHAQILRAIADGEKLQRTYEAGGPSSWQPIDHDGALTMIASGMGAWVRIKPATVMVNGVECKKDTGRGGDWVLTINKGGNSNKQLFFETEADRTQVFNALIAPFESKP